MTSSGEPCVRSRGRRSSNPLRDRVKCVFDAFRCEQRRPQGQQGQEQHQQEHPRQQKEVVKQQPEVHEEVEEVEFKACALKEALMYQGITGSVRADNSTLKVSVIDTISVVTGVNDNHAALMLPRVMQNDPDHITCDEVDTP